MRKWRPGRRRTGALLRYINENEQFHHLKIPDEISIATVGSDENVDWPPHYPPVTSFALDTKRTAECAIEMIKKILAGDLHTPNIRVPLKINLTDSIGLAPESSR